MSSFILFLMLIWQAFGLLSFLGLVSLGEKKIFYGVAPISSCLYTLRSLVHCGVGHRRCLQQAQVEDCLGLNLSPVWDYFSQSFIRLLQTWAEGSDRVLSDLKDLTGEIWFVYEELMDTFMKFAYAMKIFTLAVFFLPTLFLFMYGLFTVMLGQA